MQGMYVFHNNYTCLIHSYIFSWIPYLHTSHFQFWNPPSNVLSMSRPGLHNLPLSYGDSLHESSCPLYMIERQLPWFSSAPALILISITWWHVYYFMLSVLRWDSREYVRDGVWRVAELHMVLLNLIVEWAVWEVVV